MAERTETCSILLIRLFLFGFLFLAQTNSVADRQCIDAVPQYYLEKPISQFRFEDCSLELHTGHGSGQTESLYSHCSLNLGAESILSRGNVMVQVDIEQRQKGITMYFTFLYNTFQNHDLMWPWKANWRP